MAFVKIASGRTALLPPGTSARLSFSERGKPTLRLIFGGDVAAKLKWKAGMALSIEAGTEEDEGRVRLTAAKAGGYRLAAHGARESHLAIQARPWWPVDHMKGLTSLAAIECEHTIDKGVGQDAVIMTLPRGWFRELAERES